MTTFPTAPWINAREIAPPREGTHFVAIGAILSDDGKGGTISMPFTRRLAWNEFDECWEDADVGMSLNVDVDEKIVIHWWIEDAPAEES